MTPVYSGTQWTGTDVVNALRADGVARITRTSSEYDYLLPSIDFDIDIREDVKLRASYNETIARPTYDKLAGGVTINTNIAGFAKQNPGGFSGGASEGDPTLAPYESTNIDFSAEWYYGELSYMSIGHFTKEVTNFIGTASRQAPIASINGNLKHVGFNSDGTNSGASHGDNTLGNESNYEDVIFNISFPEQTGQKETIDGLEFAVQHDFGDYNPFPINLTGFGVIANMTVVDSDANYNNLLPNSEDDRQFAIIGISDSHNLSVYYERFGVSARIAYNWRDRFLNFSGASSGYTEEAEQVDANISYTVPDTNITLSYDGINLTEEGSHTFERNNPRYTTWRNAGHAKHYVGLRWKY